MYYGKLNKWVVTSPSIDKVKMEALAGDIAVALSLSIPTARLLINRGCRSADDAKRFIGKEEEQLYDPFLMKDMKTAAQRIIRAVESGEKIMIYGDYDVDGVTSVTSVYLYLQSLGADVFYHIPCRMSEGYGMSLEAIDKMSEEKVDLIITVDTGITAIAEIDHAMKLGIDVIVTDHHECHSELPKANAVVNPRRPDCEYPFDELAGVGVVFKLLCAMESLMNPEDSLAACVRRVARQYCDLVALGTIADVMPVKDENRLIVSYGLSLMEKGVRPAVKELMAASSSDSKYNSKKKVTAAYVGFTLAPRINAAGRIKSASIAVELLLSETTERAKKYASELCAINKERQQEENRITEQAYAKIDAEHDFEHDPIIVLDDEKWHHGIIGIVASRISEKYHMPTILISFDGNGDTVSADDLGKGSGRSIKGLNLVEALSSCSDILHKYGGHELAAGLTVKRSNLPELRRRLNSYARECPDFGEAEPVFEAECVLDPADITMKLAEELFLLEPYGTSNPVPVFLTEKMYIAEALSIGGGKHTKLILRCGNMTIVAMCFRRSLSELDLYPGDEVDVMYNLDINEFQGTRNLQMIVKDIRPTESQLKREQREHILYDGITSGMLPEDITADERMLILPAREDFAAVYNTLKRELRVEHEVFSIRALAHLMKSCGYIVPYVKLKNIIMIFRELNLIGVEELDAEREVYSFKYIYVKHKTALDKSALYKRLKNEFRSCEKNR